MLRSPHPAHPSSDPRRSCGDCALAAWRHVRYGHGGTRGHAAEQPQRHPRPSRLPRPGRRAPVTSTPPAARPAWPPTARRGPCTPPITVRSTRSCAYRTTRSRTSASSSPARLPFPDPGGYADAAAQDAFCANTTCVITKIYDQSPNHNDLTQAPRGAFSGPAMGGFDNLPIADMAPVTISGHKAYGVFIEPGMGLRDNHPTGTAVGDQPEGMYWVLDGHHFNDGCCFDYGNAEIDSRDDGNGTMETSYFGNATAWYHGNPPGPVDHDRPGEQPGGLRQPGQHLQTLRGPAEHHLAVRDRRGQGRAAPLGLAGRRRADGRPVDHVRRAAR